MRDFGFETFDNTLLKTSKNNSVISEEQIDLEGSNENTNLNVSSTLLAKQKINESQKPISAARRSRFMSNDHSSIDVNNSADQGPHPLPSLDKAARKNSVIIPSYKRYQVM